MADEELRGLRGWQASIPTTVTIKLPQYTTTQKNALTGVEEGSIVYDITLHKAYCWNGSSWNALW